MKNRLKEKLIGLGYALSYIDDKLKDWDECLKSGKAWESDDDDISIEKWQKPTEEIPKFFLNVDNLFEKVLLFDGDVYSVYKENSLNDTIQFADYSVCNKLCLLRITEK